MKKNINVFIIMGSVSILLLIAVINQWMAPKVVKSNIETNMREKAIVQTQMTHPVSRAVIPKIDSRNDPLAPLKVASKPKAKIKKAIKRSSPKKHYETTTASEFLIQ